ncbi:MAG: metalloregulator ArsR/SmtB family transcription factor [Mizugakiibacter sp.]|uniref:ArsR/SmtB family transcription factor n=1 Tax=Mizugakiibacter sp. TaxID=1972610 RepID=UPI00320D7D2A
MHAFPTRYQLAELGALLADPSRAAIVLALTDGSARPAGELARVAGVAPATASAHLRRLVAGGLLAALPQGRHRYYRIASETAAQVLETLPLLHARPAHSARAPRDDPALAYARTCYRHLAGQLGVAVYDWLSREGDLKLGADALQFDRDALQLTPRGAARLREADLLADDAHAAGLRGRACLDWTERRFHLGGTLGVQLTARMLERGWLRRTGQTRALALTPPGRAGLRRLGVAVDDRG